MAWCDVVEPRTLRECRIALGQSQAAFAALLGVSLESYRTWDAGRRATPPKILARARALATHRDDHALLPLPMLALLIGVHVKTLRAAARDGRLPVTYDTRTTFRRLRARATHAAGTQFRGAYYGRPVKPVDRRTPLTWASVPSDYDAQISRASSRARIESGPIGHAGGRSAEGRRLSMGGAETHAVARVLATNHRTPPVSWAQATSGDDHRPLGGGTNAGRELERQRDSRVCPARLRGFCGPVRRRYCRRPGGPRAPRGYPTGRPSGSLASGGW